VINGAGAYTAPSADGLYHVVASSAEEATVSASASVTVMTAASGFTPTGNLTEARGLHTATPLPNKQVLVVYGSNSTTSCYLGLSSIEFYNPDTGTFTEIVGEDGVGYFGHTATLMADG
jgi:hypothetical protein